MHLSSVARIPLALIVALSMLIATVSTVAAAPSSGSGGGSSALATHTSDLDCEVLIEGGELIRGVTGTVIDPAVVVDPALVAEINALIIAAVNLDGYLCVDIENLGAHLEICVTDAAVLAGLLAHLFAYTGDLGIDLGLIAQLLDLGLLDEFCLNLDITLGGVVVVVPPVIPPVDVDLLCVGVTIHNVGPILEVLFGDPALLTADLELLLLDLIADLDLVLGDELVICIALVPVIGDGGVVVIVPVPVIVVVGGVDINFGDINFGDINIGPITIGPFDINVVTTITNEISNTIVNDIVNDIDVVNNVDVNVRWCCRRGLRRYRWRGRLGLRRCRWHGRHRWHGRQAAQHGDRAGAERSSGRAHRPPVGGHARRSGDGGQDSPDGVAPVVALQGQRTSPGQQSGARSLYIPWYGSEPVAYAKVSARRGRRRTPRPPRCSG
ncbi:MAG: hypothetical protein LC744_07670 [Chloroflexi bacterium]|nr:hypothetical protein [Chloroflexota bacterium]